MLKKFHNLIYAAVPLAITVAVVMGNIFAASNYHMSYSSGQTSGLTDFATIDADTADSLVPLIKKTNNYETIANGWTSGFIKTTTGCHEAKYITVTSSNTYNTENPKTFDLVGDDYIARVTVKDVSVFPKYPKDEGNALGSDKKISIALRPDTNQLSVGYLTYSNNTCTTLVSNVTHLQVKGVNTSNNKQAKVFVDLHIQLYKKTDTTTPYSADGVYLGVTDFDAAQSFKIKNSNDILQKSNIIAKSRDSYQPSGTGGYVNKLVTDDTNGNYLYSEYELKNDGNSKDTDNTNDLLNLENARFFVKIPTSVQSEGLDAVFGFANSAASSIEFYGPAEDPDPAKHTVSYTTDGHGQIEGTSSEAVDDGGHPQGRNQIPEIYYQFVCWKANKTVTLTDGSTIEKGACIEDVTDVVVNENIIFTATYEKTGPDQPELQYTVTYTTDGHGTVNGDSSEVIDEGGNPMGRSQTPNENYRFVCWKANKAVTLTNGSTVNANTCINDVADVIVNEDITFTATYEYVTPTPSTYTVNYTTDGNGTITGINSESVNAGNSPKGSSQSPKTNYRFVCWKANKNVTLKNGSTVNANTCISNVTDVVVNENLTFTATYEYVEPTPTPTQYTVNYASDENGSITGKTTETVTKGNNPTGSEQTPEEGYEFVCWTTSADVTLKTGDTKTKGDCLSDDEVKNVVVNENLTFTAIHEEITDDEEEEEEKTGNKSSLIGTPETGASNGDVNAVIVPISILSILSVLVIRYLPKLFHKKIGFN